MMFCKRSLNWRWKPVNYAVRVCSNVNLNAEVEEQLEILTKVADILGIDDISFSRSASF